MTVADSISLAVLVSAIFATLGGVIILHRLFQNKIKELFDDAHYFVFFFLTVGYVLYALGELSWYLMYKAAENSSAQTIADVYWSGGSLAMLVAFIALSRTLYKEYGTMQKAGIMIVAGIVLLALVLYYLFSVNASSDAFRYFYPLISSLILIFSFSIVLFYNQIKQFKLSLLFLFFANFAILGGDVLFTYAFTHDLNSMVGIISDVWYIAGYLLSGFFFVSLLTHFRTTVEM